MKTTVLMNVYSPENQRSDASHGSRGSSLQRDLAEGERR